VAPLMQPGKDRNVARHAAEGNFFVVTNNASDFRRLYAEQPLHAGLEIIIPSVNRVVQQRPFFGASDELARVGGQAAGGLGPQGRPATPIPAIRISTSESGARHARASQAGSTRVRFTAASFYRVLQRM
jgi:hypothetical protein